MQVFRIQPTLSYSYGSALIAAKNVAETIKLYCADHYRKYKYEDYKCTCNIVIGLDFKTTVPMVIFDDIGSE